MGAYSNRVIADGASYYWRLGESSGLTAVAAVGGANGTISGGVTLGQAGAIADGTTAMAFNGTTGRIDTATPVTIPAAVTIEGWMKPTTLAGLTATMFSSRFTAGGLQLFVSDQWLACYSDGATPPQITATTQPLLNVWQHIVLVHTGALATFYVNGVNVFSGAQTRGAQTAIPVGIGSNPGGSNFFTGALDDVAIYPRALTAAEVAAHYAIGRTTEVSAQGPYADRVISDGASNYWRLNEASGTSAVDSVGGVTATINSGVTLGQPSPLQDGTSAMTFNGTPTGKLESVATVTIPSTVTLEGWMKSTKRGASFMTALTTRIGSAEPYLFFGIDANVAFCFDGFAVASGVRDIADGVWHHVMVVCAGSSCLLYVDGVLDATRTLGSRTVVGHGAVQIGGEVVAGREWLGSLDEVAIYPRALSASEVAAHYQLSSVPVPRDLNTGLYTYLLGVFGVSAGTSYAERVKADGATNHWRLGETSGVTAVDAIGGANGTISGGVTLNQPSAMADGNGAMTFNGSTGQIVTAVPVLVPVATTIETWIKTTFFGQQAAFSTRTSGAVGGVVFIGSSNGLPFLFCNTSTPTLLQGTTLVNTGQWRHVVYVLNGTTCVMYVDGALDSTQPLSRATGSSGGIANLGWEPGNFWSGGLDDIVVYPRALTATEVAAHYSVGRSGLSGGNDLTTLITRYLATLSGDMTERWKQMEKNAGF